MILPRLDIE